MIQNGEISHCKASWGTSAQAGTSASCTCTSVEEMLLCVFEEQAEDIADQLLPKCAKEIVDEFLNQFKERKSAPGAAQQEDAELTRYVFFVFFCPCCVCN